MVKSLLCTIPDDHASIDITTVFCFEGMLFYFVVLGSSFFSSERFQTARSQPIGGSSTPRPVEASTKPSMLHTALENYAESKGLDRNIVDMQTVSDSEEGLPYWATLKVTISSINFRRLQFPTALIT
jgi:hypothetical protein